MLDRYTNLEEKRRIVEDMLARANACLSGAVGPIEAARSLRLYARDDAQLDKILETFVVVDSETDALPLGAVRQHWNVEALKREDIKIAQAEAWCREMVTTACRELIGALTPILAGLNRNEPR